MPAAIKWSEFIGHKFGRLTLLRVYVENGRQKADLKCDCGNLKTTSAKVLRSGDCVSCGCYNRDMVRKVATKHGYCTRKVKKTEYYCWRNMHSRCYYNHPKHTLYKQKGITMCDRWRYGENGVNGFLCFLEDMGHRPPEAQSLDRIDNDKGYYKENCRWTTFKVQMNNQSCTPKMEVNGKTVALVYAVEGTSITKSTAYYRLKRGWPNDKILSPMKDELLEKQIERKVGDYAKSKGVLFWKFVSPSNPSVPDRVIIAPGGRVGWLELKRRGQKPTPKQRAKMAELASKGATVGWVDNVEDGKQFVDKLLKEDWV